MYKKIKRLALVVMLIPLGISLSSVTKAHAMGSWAKSEYVSNQKKRVAKEKREMQKRVKEFKQKNSDKTIYLFLANVEKDIKKGFILTYNDYNNRFVVNKRNSLDKLNNDVANVKKLNVNDASSSNVIDIYNTVMNVSEEIPYDSFSDYSRDGYIKAIQDPSKIDEYSYTWYNPKTDFTEDSLISFNKKNVQSVIDAYNEDMKNENNDAYQEQVDAESLPYIVANLNYIQKKFNKYEIESKKESKALLKMSKRSNNKSIKVSKMIPMIKNVQTDLKYFINHSGNTIAFQNGHWAPYYTHMGAAPLEENLVENDVNTLDDMINVLSNMNKYSSKRKLKKHVHKKKHMHTKKHTHKRV